MRYSRLFFNGLLLLANLLPFSASQRQYFSISSPWEWRCDNNTCVKQQVGEQSGGISLAACKLTCGDLTPLWPLPTGRVDLAAELVQFLPSGLSMDKLVAPTTEVLTLLTQGAALFIENVNNLVPAQLRVAETSSFSPPVYSNIQQSVEIQVTVTSDETQLKLTTDESYVFTINNANATTKVIILANTYFGARHALESLLQLMAWDDVSESILLVGQAAVNDKPKYPYRGVLLDTSRNYITPEAIKRTLDAMAANKLNTFHWHITDTHSFPFISRRQPLLALYGAYSAQHTYSPSVIAELVKYAQIRGIRLLPEFDAPAHVGNGWQWGEKYGKGKLALCINKEPWRDYCVEPPCGQLNPINPNVYDILQDIYADMKDLFPSDLFHMGGDEVHMHCWNETEEILKWMSDRGLGRTQDDFLQLWSYFQNESLSRVDKTFGKDTPVILWTSGLTEAGKTDRFLDPKRYIIQIWTTATDPTIAEIYGKGFPLIFSNYDALYFDCGYGAWVGNTQEDGYRNNWCSPYIGWQKVYDNRVDALIRNFNLTVNPGQLLGSEATLWTEQVDSASLDSKLWPRAAALAERLWTDPDTDWRPAEKRLINHRERLVQRGTGADALQPLWCHQNEELCH